MRHRLGAQEEELKKLRRELDQLRMTSAASSVAEAATQAVEVAGFKVLAQRVDGLNRDQMRVLVDNLRTKLVSGVVVLGSAQQDGKLALVAGVTKDLTARVQAGKLVGRRRQARRRAPAAVAPTSPKPAVRTSRSSTRPS